MSGGQSRRRGWLAEEGETTTGRSVAIGGGGKEGRNGVKEESYQPLRSIPLSFFLSFRRPSAGRGCSTLARFFPRCWRF